MQKTALMNLKKDTIYKIMNQILFQDVIHLVKLVKIIIQIMILIV